MLGAILSLVSAAFFGLNNVTVRRGVMSASVLQGMAITVPLGLPIFVLFLPIFGGTDELFGFDAEGLFWMSAAGIVHFVIGRYGNYRAIAALGATLSTPVQQLSVLVSLVLALVWLDETLTGVKVFGLALVLVGPALVVGRRKSAKEAAKTKVFTPDYPAGLFWGTVCAVGYGVSPLLIVWGLESQKSVPAALAGLIVSYVAATAVVVVLVAAAGGLAYLRGMQRGAPVWFLASTVFVALSQLLRYMALAVAPVSVVVPIQRLSVVFRVVFGAMFNRDAEIFDWTVIVGIVLSLAGTVALAIETDLVRNLLADWGPAGSLLFWEWRPG